VLLDVLRRKRGPAWPPCTRRVLGRRSRPQVDVSDSATLVVPSTAASDRPDRKYRHSCPVACACGGCRISSCPGWRQVICAETVLPARACAPRNTPASHPTVSRRSKHRRGEKGRVDGFALRCSCSRRRWSAATDPPTSRGNCSLESEARRCCQALRLRMPLPLRFARHSR
jgi:hypothetical protein